MMILKEALKLHVGYETLLEAGRQALIECMVPG